MAGEASDEKKRRFGRREAAVKRRETVDFGSKHETARDSHANLIEYRLDSS